MPAEDELVKGHAFWQLCGSTSLREKAIMLRSHYDVTRAGRPRPRTDARERLRHHRCALISWPLGGRVAIAARCRNSGRTAGVVARLRPPSNRYSGKSTDAGGGLAAPPKSRGPTFCSAPTAWGTPSAGLVGSAHPNQESPSRAHPCAPGPGPAPPHMAWQRTGGGPGK